MSAYTFVVAAAGAGGGDPDTGQKVTAGPFDSTGSTLIVLGVAFSIGFSVTDVVDSFGNTYTALVSDDNDTASTMMYCFNPITGSGHTIELKNPPSLQPGLSVMCFAGGSSSVLDTSGANSASSAVETQQPGALTPDAPDQLLVSHCAVHAAVTQATAASMSVDSPFTMPGASRTGAILAPPLGRPNYGGMMAYQLSPASSAQDPTYSWTGANTASATIARFGAIADAGEIKTQDMIGVNPISALKSVNAVTFANLDTRNRLHYHTGGGGGDYTLIAGEFLIVPDVLELFGFVDDSGDFTIPPMGSLAPTTLHGADIGAIYEQWNNDAPFQFIIYIHGDVGALFFSSVTVGADTYLIGDAGVTFNGTQTRFEWNTSESTIPGIGTYAVSFT